MTRVCITGMAELVHATNSLIHLAVYSSDVGTEVRMTLNIVVLAADDPSIGNFDQRQRTGILQTSRDEFEKLRMSMKYPPKPRSSTSITFDPVRTTHNVLRFVCADVRMDLAATSDSLHPKRDALYIAELLQLRAFGSDAGSMLATPTPAADESKPQHVLGD
ncbi:MAG TPA: hypothetical protein VIV60_23395 [Polyangiaceae bacterium]